MVPASVRAIFGYSSFIPIRVALHTFQPLPVVIRTSEHGAIVWRDSLRHIDGLWLAGTAGVKKKMETMGIRGYVLGLYSDNGKNGNYGDYKVYIGVTMVFYKYYYKDPFLHS